jgi:hypothetical protein
VSSLQVERAHVQHRRQFFGYDCPRCGKFELTGSLVSVLQSKLDGGVYRRALMSHNIRRTGHANAKPPLINTYNVESFWLGERLPTPQRQADDLILWVGDNQPAPDEFIQCEVPFEVPFLSAWVGTSLTPSTTSGGGLHWLCTYLANAKLLEARQGPQTLAREFGISVAEVERALDRMLPA